MNTLQIRAPRIVHKVGNGFTLLEALVVVAIVGVLAATGIPNLIQSFHRSTINAQASALTSSLQLARAEAIRRNNRVTLCQSLDPNANRPSCAGAQGPTGWATGWIIFQDDGNTAGELDADETIIRVQPPFGNSGGFFQSGAGGPYRPTFQGTGLPVGLINESFDIFQPGNLGAADKLAITVVVSGQGRVRIEKLKSKP